MQDVSFWIENTQPRWLGVLCWALGVFVWSPSFGALGVGYLVRASEVSTRDAGCGKATHTLPELERGVWCEGESVVGIGIETSDLGTGSRGASVSQTHSRKTPQNHRFETKILKAKTSTQTLLLCNFAFNKGFAFNFLASKRRLGNGFYR